MLARLVLAAAITISLSASLYAQNVNPNLRRLQQQQGRQQQQQQQQQLNQPTEIRGTLEGAMQGRLVVLAADSRPWQVGIPAHAKVQVTGTASAECLQAGLIVEFKAEIDDRGAVKEKVGELSIVSLSQERQIGLFPSEEGGAKAAFGEEVGADHGGKVAKPAKRTKASGGKNAIHAGSYRIVGKLTVGRGGKFSVLAGRNPLAFELAEQPTIAIDTADYTLASKGDKITVKGMVVPNNRGLLMAQATEVKIELAEPLTGPKKKTTAKSEAKRPAKRAKADEGLPEPPADK